MQISRLDYVNIREIWQHEAADFTTWLAANIDYINDKLGFTLNVLKTEKQIGSKTAILLNPFDFKYLITPSRSSGDVVAPDVDGLATTKLGFIPIRASLFMKFSIFILDKTSKIIFWGLSP